MSARLSSLANAKGVSGRNRHIKKFVALQQYKSVKLRQGADIDRLCQTTETALNLDAYTKDYMVLHSRLHL